MVLINVLWARFYSTIVWLVKYYIVCYILNINILYSVFERLDFLGDRDTEGQDPHAQSRFSVKVAYDYIYNLPDEDFVYIVDDDHLHYQAQSEHIFEEDMMKAPSEVVSLISEDFSRENNVLALNYTNL